jgi:hypothetical protein
MLFALGLGDQVAGVRPPQDDAVAVASRLPSGPRVISLDPGPRLVEGTELLARLLHPDRVEPPADVAFELVGPREIAKR